MAWICSCGSWVLKQQAGKLPCKLQSFFMTLLMHPIKCANGPWAKGSPVAEPRVRVGRRCQRAWTQEGRVCWSCCCCQSTRVGILKVWQWEAKAFNFSYFIIYCVDKCSNSCIAKGRICHHSNKISFSSESKKLQKTSEGLNICVSWKCMLKT